MPDEASSLHPIIYVRGYAMTARRDRRDHRRSVLRLQPRVDGLPRDPRSKTRPPRKFIFESPLVRLRVRLRLPGRLRRRRATSCDDGLDRARSRVRSIVIYRYYDSASTLLGDGEDAGHRGRSRSGLSDLILQRARARLRATPRTRSTPRRLPLLSRRPLDGRARVPRVPAERERSARTRRARCVDKFFTYATPHNGIDVGRHQRAGVADGSSDIDNFNRERMAEYLDLEHRLREDGAGRLDPGGGVSVRARVLPGRHEPQRLRGRGRACRGRSSGTAATGWCASRTRSVCGVKANGAALRAVRRQRIVYRAHSGFFGIVNSEEAYQNLMRFLFGDVRVDLWVDVEDDRGCRRSSRRPTTRRTARTRSTSSRCWPRRAASSGTSPGGRPRRIRSRVSRTRNGSPRAGSR